MAGIDADGLLQSYGIRELIGRLTPELRIALSDADGKTYASLPAARVGEDEDLIKTAKKQLMAARKEAKAVLTLQKGRLYGAMRAGRTWKGARWREALAAHPLMRQLCTRLIWAVILADAAVSTTFRLAEDGALIGVDDSMIDLPDDADVALARGTILSQTRRSAWCEHLADYEVTPLFDQLTATAPEIEPGQKAFTDLEGYLTDTFALRVMATKRGYEHDAPVDGSWFDDYVKEFTSAGLSATIRFTGSYLPEDKITCATRDLTLRNRYRTLALSLVPRYCWPSAARTTRPLLRWGHSTRTGEQDQVGLIMSEGMVRGGGRPRSFPKRAPVIQGQSSASYSGSPPSAMLRRMRCCFRARHCMETTQYGYAGHSQVSEPVRRHESGSRETGGTGGRIGDGRHSVGRGSPGESHV